jgi:hypothetical protein
MHLEYLVLKVAIIKNQYSERYPEYDGVFLRLMTDWSSPLRLVYGWYVPFLASFGLCE